MRRFFFIAIAMMLSIVVFAQSHQTATKTLHTESNGFKWYLVEQYPQKGAQDINGNWIIPFSKCLGIDFEESKNHKGFFCTTLSSEKTKHKLIDEIYSLDGKLLIPKERDYELIVLRNDWGHEYFEVTTSVVEKKWGICDVRGNEILEPKYTYVGYDVNGFKTEWTDNKGNYHPLTSIGLFIDENDRPSKTFQKSKEDKDEWGVKWSLVFDGNGYGVQNANGDTLIPTSLGYTEVRLEFVEINGTFVPAFFICKKGDKNVGVHDLYGQIFFSPDFMSISYSATTGFHVTNKDNSSVNTGIFLSYNDKLIADAKAIAEKEKAEEEKAEEEKAKYLAAKVPSVSSESATTKEKSATINKMWIEHNVKQNGDKGLIVHSDVDVRGMKGRTLKGSVFILDNEKQQIKSNNGDYVPLGKYVVLTATSRPTYEDSNYSDFKIFVPYSIMPQIPGENTYWIKLIFGDADTKEFLMDKMKMEAFTLTCPSNNHVNQNVASNNNVTNNGNSTKVNLPNGGYTITTKNPDGTITVQTMTPCVICHGGKKCMVCYGTGGRYGYGGVYYPCASCAGLLYCTYCRGEGYQFSVSTSDGAGNVNTVSSDGSIASGNAAGGVIINSNGKTSVYGGGSSSSTGTQNRSANSSRVCSACGGRKYESSSYTHMPASGSGWAQPYHNSGGSVCSYCNLRTDHYHAPCSSCRGYGHN